MALAVWQATIVDESGNIQASASLQVLIEATGALAALFSDRDGASPITNPVTAGVDGFVRFYAAGGAYRIDATLGAFSRTWRHVAIGLLGERDTISETFLRYERTSAESSAGVTPTNYQYQPGHVLRYGTNSVPGTTDMTTAFQNAALSSLTPYAPAELFLITGSIPLRDTQHWTLDGTRISITGNTKVFTAAVGIDDWSIRGGTVTGDNNSTGSLSGTGAAVEITDSMRWYVGGLTAKNIKGYGIRVLPGSSVSLRAEHGQIDHPQCYACTTGMAFEAGTQPGAEYVTVKGPLITRCGLGMYVQAGNINVNGGTIVDNAMNVQLNTGANGNHGTFTGVHINHPTGTYNIHALSVSNGHTFDGCHIYEGAIWLQGCKGIVFRGGIVAPSDIINDSSVSPASGYNYFIDNYWASGYSTQVNSNNAATNELVIVGGNGPGVYHYITGVSVSDPSPVYVSARRAPASTQSLTSGVAATLVFNTESIDRRNAHNTTTGAFTVPAEQAGQYRIMANLMFSGTAMSSTASIVELKINGASVALFLPTINSTTSLAVAVVSDQYLAAADVVTLVGTITGTTPVFGHATYESRLQIQRIS